MQPQVEIASDNLAGRVHNGVRKVTDAVGNGVLDGLGTVPYIGNVLAATGTIVNVLLGVQSIIDEASGAVLDQTMQTLVIIQKLAGPGNKAVNSWVNFALNANTVLKNFKNQWDKVSASFKGKFTPEPLMTKEEILSKMDKKMSQDNPQQPNQKDDISTPDSVKPDSTELDKPNQPTSTANPQQKAAKKPGKKPVKKGGRRKNNTKKKNQKQRTKRKSRRRK